MTAFECVHDMSDPVGALRTMRRLAAGDGTVLVMDERVADAFDPEAGDVERFMYGFSVLHCLPVGLEDQPSAATGTVMRADTLRAYATVAGFGAVEVLLWSTLLPLLPPVRLGHKGPERFGASLSRTSAMTRRNDTCRHRLIDFRRKDFTMIATLYRMGTARLAYVLFLALSLLGVRLGRRPGARGDPAANLVAQRRGQHCCRHGHRRRAPL